MKSRRVLFLLRAYNDIDHIAPIIWKAVECNWCVFFVFVDEDFSDDYRIQFLIQQGAKQVKSSFIQWYSENLALRGSRRTLRKIFDTALLTAAGLSFLIRARIQVVVTEWTGHVGRRRAAYYLRPVKTLGLPVFSVPHGYFLWKNSDFNETLRDKFQSMGRFPDFSNRNWFTAYVVQSEEHKVENIKYGMNHKKLSVLGSARYCQEWLRINHKLLRVGDKKQVTSMFSVVFFLPHWDYRVDRDECLELLHAIAEESCELCIKAHTRGSGALSDDEQRGLKNYETVLLANDEDHSPVLIEKSDVVINFGSSIAFEALAQGKPVVNPKYLHGNETFFDDSGVVFDTLSNQETIQVLRKLRDHEMKPIDQDVIRKFWDLRVNSGAIEEDVLRSYLYLLSQSSGDSSEIS